MGRSERKITLMERLLEARLNGNGLALPDDAETRDKFPLLWDALTFTGMGTEYLLEPARLSVGLAVGTWTVTLSSAALQTRLEACSPTLAGMFEAWERAAGGPNPAWRNWGREEIRLHKRRKPKSP
jgi:hypothetical protein